ncbi:MAG: FAD-dependent protein, partial [Methylophilaceae bacterium]
NGIFIEPKAFSIGFRIEHPQGLIDRSRYGKSHSEDLLTKLGAADYKLVHHAKNGRSVYSFCMCPGGTVVAAASEPERVVTNGMSQYSRNERNANAGIVVGITPEEDFPGHPLAGMELQRQLEGNAYIMGGSNYNAPGQLVGDFLANKASTHLGEVTPSYTPGVTLTNLADALPEFAINAMREAIPEFAKKIDGFDLHDAILTGVETRTSAPIRIKRDDDTFESINTKGLFPCGEGAGYAGGILSAGVDGIKVAEAVAISLTTA